LEVECSVNGAAGKEYKIRFKPRKKPKSVVIVGGGVAGMEAARISAIRNHKVVLFEKENQLGGNVRTAGIPKDRFEVLTLIDYLTHQMRKLNVEVRTGVTFKPNMIGDLKPEVLILATGALPMVPRIKGVGLNHVKFAEEIWKNPVPSAKSVVIIGGGLIGCETASHLLDQGIGSITVVEILDDIAADEERISKKVLIKKLMEHGVRVLLETHVERIEKRRVLVKNKIGERSHIDADLVVIATGYKPDKRLYNKIVKKYPRLSSHIFCIGDCSRTGKIYEAIHDGFNLGFKI
jgi:NADPH-dependent 2,4-dienoyl-CoA reductase/sulfur reductase-like enzyme